MSARGHGIRWLAPALGWAVLPGCRPGVQDALAPAGPQAGRIEGLWWQFFWISAAVFALVMVFLLLAAIRRSHDPSDAPEVDKPRRPDVRSPDPAVERRLTVWTGGATALTTVILFVLLVASIGTTGRLHSLDTQDALTIDVIGHQWWWEVQYPDAVPSQRVTTANELHIPVGKPVQVRLDSRDVIHSFWVPNLHGKQDLIPGHPSTIFLQADTPGIYRGQCAEFCGHQHAKMAFFVHAEPQEQFDAWLQRQRQPAPPPKTEAEQRGQQVFLSGPCALCHAIQGTEAAGRTGPDLTHLASRQTLAAGSLPNTPGHLAGWIANPQGPKPGNHMPQVLLSSEDLQALLAYLETLK